MPLKRVVLLKETGEEEEWPAYRDTDVFSFYQCL